MKKKVFIATRKLKVDDKWLQPGDEIKNFEDFPHRNQDALLSLEFVKVEEREIKTKDTKTKSKKTTTKK